MWKSCFSAALSNCLVVILCDELTHREPYLTFDREKKVLSEVLLSRRLVNKRVLPTLL
jgi:hypothetical protein